MKKTTPLLLFKQEDKYMNIAKEEFYYSLFILCLYCWGHG